MILSIPFLPIRQQAGRQFSGMDVRDGCPTIPAFFLKLSIMNAGSPLPLKYTVQALAGLRQNKVNERLPCRGCTRHCGNYGYCNGKPWRM
jgi:hypothetical protein